MLTIVGWLWHDELCRNQYLPEHVDNWARMIHRNLNMPHRFVLVTDHIQAKFCSLVEKIRLWEDWRNIRCAHWREEFPQCWVRLKAFSRQARELFGERFVSIDLDCVVTGNLDGILGRTEDFVICRRPAIKQDAINVYQASMWMMTAGAREKVWTDFAGVPSLEQITQEYPPEIAAHYLATDQGWMLYKLGPDEAFWNMTDGVFFWPWLKQYGRDVDLPYNARIVFFQGTEKPWSLDNPPPWMSL